MSETHELQNLKSIAFSYELPAERIAQRPVHPYDQARMLVVSPADDRLAETTFSHLDALLSPGDLLVFNDTQVLPARFLGTLRETGARIEILILHRAAGAADEWLAMGRPLKKCRAGSEIEFAQKLTATVVERCGEYEIRVRFRSPAGEDLKSLMDRVGLMPVPPYIRSGLSDDQDRLDYQTMFAKLEGSVAAPTASLHFTPELIERIRSRGVAIETATLHVGAPSFLALWDENSAGMRPPGVERYRYDSAILAKAAEVRRNGGRVIAVGTTMVRALESMARGSGAGEELASSSLFIYPGFEFQIVDAMITNFHQPRTTHLLLVQAFMGEDLLRRSYDYALNHGFRFLSYGDGMFIESRHRSAHF